MEFAVYEIETGKILWFVTGPYEVALEQEIDGRSIFLNCPKDATHIIDNLPVTILS